MICEPHSQIGSGPRRSRAQGSPVLTAQQDPRNEQRMLRAQDCCLHNPFHPLDSPGPRILLSTY